MLVSVKVIFTERSSLFSILPQSFRYSRTPTALLGTSTKSSFSKYVSSRQICTKQSSSKHLKTHMMRSVIGSFQSAKSISNSLNSKMTRFLKSFIIVQPFTSAKATRAYFKQATNAKTFIS